jgi:hypothetical protein
MTEQPLWDEYVTVLREATQARRMALDRLEREEQDLAEAVTTANEDLRSIILGRNAAEQELGELQKYTDTALQGLAVTGPHPSVSTPAILTIDDLLRTSRWLREEIRETAERLALAREKTRQSAEMRRQRVAATALAIASFSLALAIGGSVSDALGSGVIVILSQIISHHNRPGMRPTLISGCIALALMLLLVSIGGSWPVGIIALTIVVLVFSHRT